MNYIVFKPHLKQPPGAVLLPNDVFSVGLCFYVLMHQWLVYFNNMLIWPNFPWCSKGIFQHSFHPNLARPYLQPMCYYHRHTFPNIFLHCEKHRRLLGKVLTNLTTSYIQRTSIISELLSAGKCVEIIVCGNPTYSTETVTAFLKL